MDDCNSYSKAIEKLRGISEREQATLAFYMLGYLHNDEYLCQRIIDQCEAVK